jgi:hypothetical protein
VGNLDLNASSPNFQADGKIAQADPSPKNETPTTSDRLLAGELRIQSEDLATKIDTPSETLAGAPQYPDSRTIDDPAQCHRERYEAIAYSVMPRSRKTSTGRDGSRLARSGGNLCSSIGPSS